MKLLIIQPWFFAVGHPAQSLLNMASALGKDERVEYLVSGSSESGRFLDSLEQLKTWGKVEEFFTTTPTGDLNTLRALWALWRKRLNGCQYQRVFFFDESLFVLALFWPLFSLCLSIERVGVLHLHGPRFASRSWFHSIVIKRFLKRSEVRLYLRTEELTVAWRDAHRTVAESQIRYLPSLEIPNEDSLENLKIRSDEVAFGIIGQIRVGKAIEWLVPAFRNEPALGKLTVAGEFNMPQTREKLSVLSEFDGFINCFMTEGEMLALAAEQDYLLMLYEEWDKRMESAVLYLAARVGRPVVVYGDSWCGRMVQEHGCGVIAPFGHEQTVNFLRRVPRPGSAEYAKLLEGVDAFRQANSVKSLRGKVMQELLG
jgi:hypothetical protein